MPIGNVEGAIELTNRERAIAKAKNDALVRKNGGDPVLLDMLSNGLMRYFPESPMPPKERKRGANTVKMLVRILEAEPAPLEIIE